MKLVWDYDVGLWYGTEVWNWYGTVVYDCGMELLCGTVVKDCGMVL